LCPTACCAVGEQLRSRLLGAVVVAGAVLEGEKTNPAPSAALKLPKLMACYGAHLHLTQIEGVAEHLGRIAGAERLQDGLRVGGLLEHHTYELRDTGLLLAKRLIEGVHEDR
jgi:hypothetical protein